MNLSAKCVSEVSATIDHDEIPIFSKAITQSGKMRVTVKNWPV